MTTSQLYLLGLKRTFPIVLGYIPVGIAYAVYAGQNGFTPWEIVLMSITNYSGSGQFFIVSMAGTAAPLPVFMLALVLMNFRYFIMSTCVFNKFKKLSFIKRTLFSHLVTDETFALFTTSEKELISVPYFVGIFLTAWIAWITGAALGVLASSFLPQALTQALGIALFALFIAILVPAGKKDLRVAVLIIATAILNTCLYHYIKESHAIVISTILMAVIGATFIKNKGTADECNIESVEKELEEEKDKLAKKSQEQESK